MTDTPSATGSTPHGTFLVELHDPDTDRGRQQIETIAKALFDTPECPRTWDRAVESVRDNYRYQVRVVLDALQDGA